MRVAFCKKVQKKNVDNADLADLNRLDGKECFEVSGCGRNHAVYLNFGKSLPT